MRNVLATLALVLAACSAGGLSGGDDNTVVDGNTGMGDAVPCGLQIGFDPIDPVASSVLPIRAYTNLVNTAGVLSFTWTVTSGAGSFVGHSVTRTDEFGNTSIRFVPSSHRATVRASAPNATGWAEFKVLPEPKAIYTTSQTAGTPCGEWCCHRQCG